MHEVELDKEMDAGALSSAIMGEESTGYVFQRNEIREEAGGKTNVATFDVHPQGRYPEDCILVVGGEEAPAGHVKEWAGRMIVAGQERDVELHRVKP